MHNLVTIINDSWGWKGIVATEVALINEFGNIVFRNEVGEYWRICPEEVSCEKIADNESDLTQVLADYEFLDDWKMLSLVQVAKTYLGDLEEGQCYCLKVPAIIGGEYKVDNIGKIDLLELIRFSGDLGFQIKDLEDGDTINFVK